MSDSTDQTSTFPPARTSQVSLVALVVLAGLFTASTTAAVVLAFLTFKPQPAHATEQRAVQPASPSPQPPRPPEEPFPQKGVVKTDGLNGIVYYPVPYASPPHVTLTARSPRNYVLTKQDELGFTWALNLTPKEIKAAAEALVKDPDAKPPRDELTWEARGMRGGTVTPYPQLFEQKGTFRSNVSQGEVFFPFPYASPPHVTFAGPGLVQPSVEACTTIGFTWRTPHATQQDVAWTARGIKATAEQVAQQVKNAPHGPLLTPVQQSGEFNYDYGQQGEVFFARPFGSPPNVELSSSSVLITQVTGTGFKWQDRYAPAKGKTYSGRTPSATWTAKGVKTAAPPEKPDKPKIP